MIRLTRPWYWFVAAEAVGVLAGNASALFESAIGPVLWGTGFLLMLPGSYVIGATVEHALWGTSFSLRQIYIAETLSSIAFNAILFAIVLWGVRFLNARRAI
jgi:hypothetical protein